MTTLSIQLWHRRARPAPTPNDFNVQLGCHFEEIEEMMRSLKTSDDEAWESLTLAVHHLAALLKTNVLRATIKDRKEFLDAIADQVVTGIGAGHCAGMDADEAIARVNQSNWSKFDENGQPIFDANGKITKGPGYAPPDLGGLF